MNKELETLLIAKGMIASLPAEQRAKVVVCIEEIKASVEKAGRIEGMLAVGMVGAEMQTDETTHP